MDHLYLFFVFIPILTFHEFAHAWMAHMLGDDTAKQEGRLTMNPLSHIDPIGTLLIPAIGLFLMPSGIGLIGWGKPVPFNSQNFTRPRRDCILVALAGPASNILLAFLAMLAGKYVVAFDPSLLQLTETFAFVSIFLAVFNLLPFPPFDGWRVAQNLFNLPAQWEHNAGIFTFIIITIIINTPLCMGVIKETTFGILWLLSKGTGAA